MFGKKRRLTAAVCFALCLTFVWAPQAMAAAPSDSGETEIMPLMEYIYSARHSFQIDDGEAIMSATVSGQSSIATKCEISIELQEKGLLFWDTIETWTTVESGRDAKLTATYEVAANKSYRMIATVTVWSGNDSETQTMTSDTLKT